MDWLGRTVMRSGFVYMATRSESFSRIGRGCCAERIWRVHKLSISRLLRTAQLCTCLTKMILICSRKNQAAAPSWVLIVVHVYGVLSRRRLASHVTIGA